MRLKLAGLEQVSANEILLVLLRSEPLKITDLVKQVHIPASTIYRAIPKLKNLGLLNDELTKYPIKRMFSLTDKGRRIAEKLAEIETILGGGENKL